MEKEKKNGRLSRLEWDYIERNADFKTPIQIAEDLNRDPETVIKYLQKIGKSLHKQKDYEVQAEYDLKSKVYWKDLQDQFSPAEIELFMAHWSKIVAQFRKDILHTEELQILALIKTEILMSRAMKEQYHAMLRLRELEDQLSAELRKDVPDAVIATNLEHQIALFRAAKENLGREHKDLQSKSSQLYKELKATREQRIEKVENNKETFANLVSRIARDTEFCEEMSLEMEKMRIAVQNEKERLGDYHTYADGTIDQPFLTHETVL